MQSNPRVSAGLWLAIGGIMATMYAINAIQASSLAYFFVAFGWALLGAAQWWRWRSEVTPSGASQSARGPDHLARYVTFIAFLVIVGGLAARWWA